MQNEKKVKKFRLELYRGETKNPFFPNVFYGWPLTNLTNFYKTKTNSRTKFSVVERNYYLIFENPIFLRIRSIIHNCGVLYVYTHSRISKFLFVENDENRTYNFLEQFLTKV